MQQGAGMTVRCIYCQQDVVVPGDRVHSDSQRTLVPASSATERSQAHARDIHRGWEAFGQHKRQEIRSESNTRLVLGVALLVSAIIAAIAAQPMYRKANTVAMFESMERGNQMSLTADIVKYCGYGAGAIGIVLLFVGLMKKSER